MDLQLKKFMWRQQMAISALLTYASQELNKAKVYVTAPSHETKKTEVIPRMMWNSVE
jgi:hypothetical protein